MQSERIEIDKMECDSMEEKKNFVSQCVSDRGNVALAVDEQGFLWKGTVRSAEDVDHGMQGCLSDGIWLLHHGL